MRTPDEPEHDYTDDVLFQCENCNCLSLTQSEVDGEFELSCGGGIGNYLILTADEVRRLGEQIIEFSQMPFELDEDEDE